MVSSRLTCEARAPDMVATGKTSQAVPRKMTAARTIPPAGCAFAGELQQCVLADLPKRTLRQTVRACGTETDAPRAQPPQSLWASGGAMFPNTGGTHSLNNGKTLQADKEIVLIRHGMSTWNVEGRVQGNTDKSILTELGEEQAYKVKQAISSIPFDSCFASPITRAKATAEIIWDGREEELVYLDTLKEANLNVLQGRLNEDVKRETPELWRTWRNMPHLFCVDGVYPIVDLWDQASEAWQEILAAPGSIHLVVTHKSILRAMVCVALGLPPSAFRAIDIHNSGVSRLRVNTEGEAMLVNLNLTTHLHMDNVRY